MERDRTAIACHDVACIGHAVDFDLHPLHEQAVIRTTSGDAGAGVASFTGPAQAARSEQASTAANRNRTQSRRAQIHKSMSRCPV